MKESAKRTVSAFVTVGLIAAALLLACSAPPTEPDAGMQRVDTRANVVPIVCDAGDPTCTPPDSSPPPVIDMTRCRFVLTTDPVTGETGDKIVCDP
jgi:hypothetical protein